VTFIIASISVYFQLLKTPTKKLSQVPIFWIATAFFIYYSLVLLLSIFDNFLIFDQRISIEAYRIIHFINLMANIAKNFILFYALVLIDKGYPDSLNPAKAT
jgi:hypothetical protein